MNKNDLKKKKYVSTEQPVQDLIEVCCDFQAFLVCVLDKKGIILTANKNCCLLFARKEDQLRGNSFVDLMTDRSSRTHFRTMIKQKPQKRRSADAYCEVLINSAKGNILYGLTLCALDERSSSDMAFVLIGVDIQSKKHISNRIREREERFRLLVEHTTDWIWEVDHTLRVTYSNNNCKKVLGYTRKELIGKKPFDFMDRKEGRHLKEIFSQSQKKRTPIHGLAYSVLTKKGMTIIIETNALPLWHHDGSFKGFRGINRDITESVRKTAELQTVIKEKEELARTIESTPVVVFVWRAEDNWPIDFVTDNIRTFGYDPKDFLSGRLTYASIIHPDDVVRVYEEVNQYSMNPACTSFEQEYRIISKNGQVYWIDDRTTIQRDKNGKITQYQGVILDITQKKEAENKVRLIQNQQRAILDNIPDIAWLKDLESRFITVNKAFLMQCGKVLSEVIGKTDFDFWDEAIAHRYRENDLQIIKSKQSLCVEEPFVGCDGSLSTIETYKTPIYDDAGAVIGTTGIAHDITERRKRESQLRLLSAAVEQSSEGHALISLSGDFLYVNKAYAAMHGYAPTDMQGTSWSRYHSVEQMKCMLRAKETALKKGSFKGELLQLHKDGRSFPSDVSISVLRDELENVSGFIISARDISLQKKTKDALREKKEALEKKNIALNELLAQIELEKKYIKEGVAANIEKLILPIVSKLRTYTQQDAATYLDMLEMNLADMCSSFGQRISQKSLLLTPREIEICNMIKSGMSNKEISELLHVSLETIETHRSNIRKKLDLTNKNVNLSVYLQSI